MVNPKVLTFLAPLLLAACAERYEQPISYTPHGNAIRTNMAAQIINPTPPAPRVPVSDAARAALAIERYRTDEVKDPTAQSTAPNTVAQ